MTSSAIAPLLIQKKYPPGGDTVGVSVPGDPNLVIREPLALQTFHRLHYV